MVRGGREERDCIAATVSVDLGTLSHIEEEKTSININNVLTEHSPRNLRGLTICLGSIESTLSRTHLFLYTH